MEDNPKKQRVETTDFGNIFSKTPTRIFRPQTIDELAKILNSLNEQGVPVTVKNTGHSVNGQTLTDGTQIILADMIWSNFDKTAMEVTVGAGVSWNNLFKTIKFPEYCTPVFPDNPGQLIHVTGTIAVGGIGNYSARAGGLWNYVKRITLVTMEGKIISCSKEENPDLFRYSLGGFGRIGVIAEATLVVEKRMSQVATTTIVRRNRSSMAQTLAHAAHDKRFTGIIFGFGRAIVRPFPLIIFPAHAILGLAETQEISNFQKAVRAKYRHGVLFRHPFIALSGPGTISKHDAVYHTPESFTLQDEGDGLCHPWSDYGIPLKYLRLFLDRTHELLRFYHLNDFGIVEKIQAMPLRVRFEAVGFLLKSNPSASEFSFPLSLDLPSEDVIAGIGCWLAVPYERMKNAEAFINELTAFCYSMGGKRYLYGWHQLTKAQVEQQFGKKAIGQWNEIKKRVDPKGLLNRGVIEYLDTM
ncbi:MAG: FAD-binding oxidoreductase [Patescibacteria group bacterium]